MSKANYPQNYRLPAEFEPQEAIWLSWPSNKESCPKTFHKLQDKFGEIASVISRYERVRINAPMLAHMNIRLSIATTRAISPRWTFTSTTRTTCGAATTARSSSSTTKPARWPSPTGNSIPARPTGCCYNTKKIRAQVKTTTIVC